MSPLCSAPDDVFITSRKDDVLRSVLKDTRGGLDDALGLIVEVALFTLVFAFGGVFIGSATAQALAAIVAHHLAALETTSSVAFAKQQAEEEGNTYLLAPSTDVTTAIAQCATSQSACVVFEPCSASQPVCTVVVERRVMLPVVNTQIVWTAKAVSPWQGPISQ
jgi:hypothetical protein